MELLKRAALSGAAGVITTLIIQTSAFAYHTVGHHWGGNPANNATINVQFAASWNNSSFQSRFVDAMNKWNAATNQVTFVAAASSPLIVRDTANPDVYYTGLTTWRPTPTTADFDVTPLGNFSSVTITLSTVGMTGYSASKVLSVAAHEMGHSIGLWHQITPNPGIALMHPYTSVRFEDANGHGPRVNTPQADDINGANFLY